MFKWWLFSSQKLTRRQNFDSDDIKNKIKLLKFHIIFNLPEYNFWYKETAGILLDRKNKLPKQIIGYLPSNMSSSFWNPSFTKTWGRNVLRLVWTGAFRVSRLSPISPSPWIWTSSDEDFSWGFNEKDFFTASEKLAEMSLLRWETMRVDPPGKHSALRMSALMGSLRALPLVSTSAIDTKPCNHNPLS